MTRYSGFASKVPWLPPRSAPGSARKADLQAELQARSPVVLLDNPEEAARAAGLRYISDSRPGLVRRKHGGGFRYNRP